MENILETNLKEIAVEIKSHAPEVPTLEKVDEATWEQVCEYRKLLDRLDYLKCLSELEKVKNGER